MAKKHLTVDEKVERRRAAQAATAPATPPSTQVTKRNEEYVSRYHAEDDAEDNSGVTYAGRLLKFNGQSGVYTAEGGEQIPERTEFVAYADFAADGWLRFGDDKTISLMGLRFDPNWVVPLEKDLPDNDRADWRDGLDGKLRSPWVRTISVPLENTMTGAFFTLSVQSPSARHSIDRFLHEYKLMRRRSPNALPVVELSSGSFKGKTGATVFKPILVVKGRVEAGANKLPDTSTAGYLNDALPDSMTE
jgi:hypothetical protein